MRRSMFLAMVTVTVAGLAASASGATPDIQVIAGTGPWRSGPMFDPTSSAFLTQIEHASASPGGRVVVVGRATGLAGSTGQATWVRDAGPDGAWRLRVISGVTRVNNVLEGRVQTLVAPPIVNDRGEVLLVAIMTGQSPTSAAITTSTALLRSNLDGTADVVVRFGATAGPGVPGGLPFGTTSVPFTGPSTDTWRFSDAGSLYASASLGLIGPCGGAGDGLGMCMRTVINRSTNGGVPQPTGGTAIPVSTVRTAIAMTSAGYSVQAVTSTGYTRDQLAGLVMFNPWGIGGFAVQDGSTAIDGLPDQFVLSTLTGSSSDATGAPVGATGGSRAGLNSACTLAFIGRFGPLPVTTGNLPPNTQLPPPTIAGPTGLFVKQPSQPAHLLAQIPLAGATSSDLPGMPPGMPGWRFTGFGSPIVSATGDVVFTASIAGPTGTRQSIWLAGKNGALDLLAMTGVAGASNAKGAPAWAAGSTFASLSTEPTINRRGQVVYFARVSVPGQGAAGPTTFDAICAHDPLSGPTILARSGQLVNVQGLGQLPLGLSELADIGGRLMIGSGNDDGLATRLTDDGEVVFRANAATVGTIVATVRIPTPSGACCAGTTCEVQAALDCVGTARHFSGFNTGCAASDDRTTTCCPADFDQNGSVGLGDLLGFINAWVAADPITDMTGDATIGIDDLVGYVQAYLGGC